MGWMIWVSAAAFGTLLGMGLFAWMRPRGSRREAGLAAGFVALLACTLLALTLAESFPTWNTRLLAAALGLGLSAGFIYLLVNPRMWLLPSALIGLIIGAILAALVLVSRYDPVERVNVLYSLMLIPMIGALLPLEGAERQKHLQWQAGLLSFAIYGAGLALHRLTDLSKLSVHLILFLALAVQANRTSVLLADGKPKPSQRTWKQDLLRSLLFSILVLLVVFAPPWTMLAVSVVAGWLWVAVSYLAGGGTRWFRLRLLAATVLTTALLPIAITHSWSLQFSVVIPVLLLLAEGGLGRIVNPKQPLRMQMQGLSAGLGLAVLLLAFPSLEPVWTTLACLALASYTVAGLQKNEPAVQLRQSLTVAWRA
jgi:hypothetical protein